MSEDSQKKATPEVVAKAMAVLSALAGEKVQKGHTSGQTVTTKVEPTVSGKGDANVQLFHTGDQNVTSWAGSTASDVSQDDNVSTNGTDYTGGGVRKSILDAVQKGDLTVDKAVELLKALDMDKKGEPDGDKDDDKDDEEDKEDKPSKPAFAKGKAKKVVKSLEDSLEDVSDVIDASDVLSAGFGGIVKSLKAIEERLEGLEKGLSDKLAETAGSQSQFNKSLSSAVKGIAEALVVTSERVQAVETSPARGPKSVQDSLAKGLGAGKFNPTKTQVEEALFELLKKGQCSEHENLSFISTGTLSESLAAKVRLQIEGK
jgi:hypothetical protein